MIENNNYINILGFMVTELNLKGNELLIYACIFGFSQDGEGSYTGGLKYLMDWCSVSKPTVISVLKSLENKQLIEKSEKFVAKNMKFCEYRVTDIWRLKNLTTSKVFEDSGKNSLQGRLNNLTPSGKETLPNIKCSNIKDNKSLINDYVGQKNNEPSYSKEIKQIVDYWNDKLKPLGIAGVVKLSNNSKRHTYTIARIKEYGIDEIIKAIDMVAESDYCQGKNKFGWKITYEWLMKPSNFIKVIEGTYKNRVAVPISDNNILDWSKI